MDCEKQTDLMIFLFKKNHDPQDKNPLGYDTPYCKQNLLFKRY